MIQGVNMSPTVTASRPILGRINENGRIVIPAALREEMGVKPGDAVLMEVKDGVLRVESHVARIRRIQSEVAKYAKPGVLASDELIAERRAEARREEEEIAHDRELYQERLLKAAQVA
jgi:AbrB family looped-hinge helix DNA binding protein